MPTPAVQKDPNIVHVAGLEALARVLPTTGGNPGMIPEQLSDALRHLTDASFAKEKLGARPSRSDEALAEKAIDEANIGLTAAINAHAEGLGVHKRMLQQHVAVTYKAQLNTALGQTGRGYD